METKEKCGKCGAKIKQIKSAKGSLIEVDKAVVLVWIYDYPTKGYSLVSAFTTHHKTCIANKWRKKSE